MEHVKVLSLVVKLPNDLGLKVSSVSKVAAGAIHPCSSSCVCSFLEDLVGLSSLELFLLERFDSSLLILRIGAVNTLVNDRDFLLSFVGPSRNGLPLGVGTEINDIAAFVTLMVGFVPL